MSNTGKITVFVEDELTKEYLNTVWSDSLVRLGITCAGNINSVRNLVAYNLSNNIVCFGIVDRDFRWSDDDRKGSVFTLRKHEIENYLLDAAAVNASDFNSGNNLSVCDIIQRIDSFVDSKKYWFACCYLLYKLNLLVLDGFPSHPPIASITDEQGIVSYLNNCEYFNHVSNRIDTFKPSNVGTYVSDTQAEIDALYTGQKQLTYFPGKEVFKNLRGTLPGSNYADGKTMDIDLAKEIGEYQVLNNSVPDELVKIKETILSS